MPSAARFFIFAAVVRYLKASLIIGLIVFLCVTALLAVGAFAACDQALWAFSNHAGTAPRPTEWTILLVALAAFSIAWTTVDIPRPLLKIIVAIVVFGELIGAAWVLHIYGFYFSPFAPAAAVAGSAFGGLVYGLSEVGRRKKMVTQLFAERISEQTQHQLVNGRMALTFGGELREATVMVCEILNHDALMAALPIGDYVAMTNRFLSDASEFLVQKGGYLDACDGESLRVVFGVPLSDGNHAVHAAKAGLELMQQVAVLNREFFEKTQQMLDCRIGINSGEMVTAAYGSQRLGAFSVAGEPVEFAAKLCIANAIYGSRILLGSRTQVEASGEIEVRPMELIRGVDDRYREEVYELLSAKDGLDQDAATRRDIFWKGIIYFREQLWDQALKCFYEALPSEGEDAPVLFYIKRTEHLRAGSPIRELENIRL